MKKLHLQDKQASLRQPYFRSLVTWLMAPQAFVASYNTTAHIRAVIKHHPTHNTPNYITSGRGGGGQHTLAHVRRDKPYLLMEYRCVDEQHSGQP